MSDPVDEYMRKVAGDERARAMLDAMQSAERDRLTRQRIGQTEVKEVPITATGTWTPKFQGTTIAGTFVYSTQFGRYTRIGNMVFFRGRCQINTISVAPTGNMQITGLPITSTSTTNDVGGVTFDYISNFNNAASAIQLTGAIVASSAVIDLYESFDNGAAVAAPAANFTNAACDLIFCGMYATGAT